MSSLTPYESNVSYTVGSHQGRAVLTLEIASPGTFRITATGPEVPGAGLAIGDNVGSEIMRILVAVPLVLLAIFGAGTVLVIRLVRKRALRLKSAQLESGGADPTPPPPPSS